ncbi:hypothetical protein H5410_002658 [Solanum commersonii]|uniref:Uncharacterized protein n=1 Tax=Solanum commersonii TaxID=4109 RepID=A0A9J6B2G0_SOLCO|nr:hypothetical protein H5410_002658 [Solanum commersonii]
MKSLELDEEVHDKICSFLCTSCSESDYKSDAGYEEDIDLLESSHSNQHENINACRCRGDICSCESDEFFKLQSQFEDLNINTITSDNVIEFLKELTDNNLCEKIIQLAVNNSAMNNRLAKQHVIIRDSTFADLKGEIENLKNDIKSIKHNQMIYDYRLTQIETATSKGKSIDEDNTLYHPIILGTPFINAIYPFTSIIAKGFFATYKDQNISYIFIIDSIARDIIALINIKQKHIDCLRLELFSMNIFDTLKSTKVPKKLN